MRAIPAELYPFEGQFFERPSERSSGADEAPVSPLRYHYLDEGPEEATAPAVLMVHGNPTWSFYYRELVKALRPTHRCVVPDHIGCGFSDKPDDADYTYTLRSRVEDLEALVEHLDLRDVTLVVHDWGGMIGMAWATRNPERVKRIVVLNTAAFHMPSSKVLPRSLWLARNSRFGAFLVRGFNAFSAGATRMAVTRRKLSKPVRDAYTAPYDSWDDRIATLRFVQDIPLESGDPGYDIVSETQEKLSLFAETPALICWGEKDFVFDHHFLAEWERHWPHTAVHRFPECGHYVLEDATDEIIELVREFVED